MTENQENLRPKIGKSSKADLDALILIPGGAGKSRKGLPTKKLYFRRLYAPCFPFSPNRGECIALTWKEYEQWLNDPSTIAKKKPDKTNEKNGYIQEQGSLFKK